MGKISSTGAAALVFVVTAIATADANDRSVRAVMIPPSACEAPATTTAKLSAAGWTVQNGDSAAFICPLPINNIELGGTTDDNDITKFRVHYRDSDGLGTVNSVDVVLIQHRVGPFVQTGICGATLAPSTTDFTSSTVPCVHDVASGGRFYQFFVRLKSGPAGSASFLGIDFP